MSDGPLKNETAEMEGKPKTLMKTVKELFVKRNEHEYSNDENLDSIKKNIFQHAHRGHRKKIMKRLLNPTIEDIAELYASSEESVESGLDKESIIPLSPDPKDEELQIQISRNKTVTILKSAGEISNSIKNNAVFSLHPSKDVLEKHCQKDIFNPVPRTSKRVRIRSLSASNTKSVIYENKSSDQKDRGKEASSFQSLDDQDLLYNSAYKHKNNNNNRMSPSSSNHNNNYYYDKGKESSFPLLQNTQMLAPFFDPSGKELTPVFEISDGPDYFETLKIVESEKRHQKKYYKTLVAKGVTNFLVETETDDRIKHEENLSKELPLIPKLFRRKSLESTGFLSIDHRESTTKTAKQKEIKSLRKSRQTISYKQADHINFKPHQETLEIPQDVSDQNSEAEINLETNPTEMNKTEVNIQQEKLNNTSSTNLLTAPTPKRIPNVSSNSNSKMCDAKISDSISTDGDLSFEIICPAAGTKNLSVKSCITPLAIPVVLPEEHTKESLTRKSDISSPARLESFVENVKSKEGKDASSPIFSTSEEDCQSLSLAFTPTAIKKSHSETSDSIQLDQVEVRPESVHKMLTLQQEILGLPSKYNDPNRYGAFDLVKLNYQGMEKYLRYQVFHHLKREQRERRRARRETRAGEPSVSLSDSDQQEDEEEVKTIREERRMMKRSGSHSSSCSLFPTTTATNTTGNAYGTRTRTRRGAATKKTKKKLTFPLSICDHMKTCFQLKILKPNSNWLLGFCWKKKSAVAPETTCKSQKLSSHFQSCSSADSKSGVGNNNKDGDDDDDNDNDNDSGDDDDDEDEESTMSRSTNRRRKELQSMIEGREVTDSSYTETYESESEDETKSNLQEEFFNHGSSRIHSSASMKKEDLSQSPRTRTTEQTQFSHNEHDSAKKE